MKSQLIATALIVGSLYLTGCAGASLSSGGSDSGSSGSVGIDPITQAGIDATNAATNDQSAQDVRDAAAAAVQASAN
jgi:hypothetical protein